MFENAVMLAGLGGAVVPLVIHLLGRARYQSVEWGAMMFLDPDVGPKFREPGKLREWTLLAVRMAAVGLLAFALARPVFDSLGSERALASGGGGGGSGDPRIAAAIVVDCSASMGYQDVGGSRIEQARRAVLQVLSTMKRGDRAALFPVAPGAPAGELSGDLQAVAARTRDLEPVAGRTDLARTIEAAADLLGRQERVSRQLFVITDRQASNWESVNGEFVDRWSAHAPLARFVVIPVGGSETDNLLIESLALVNPPVVDGCPGQVQVRVRNLGDEPRLGVPLVLRLDRREIFSTTLNVPARQTMTTTAAVTFAGAGQRVLSAELRGTRAGPTLDDHREVVVEVSPPLRTLLVRSRRSGGEADPLRAALAPRGEKGQIAGSAVAAVDEVLADQWDPSKLAVYRLVLLDDVVALDEQQVAALEQFVYAGGGLVIAPGPAAQTNEYNRLMYREEGALLPALLQPPTSPPAPVGIDDGSIDTWHALMHFLAGEIAAPTAEFHRYIATTARTPEARVLASYTSGDEFVMEAPFGRGRVVLLTCSLSADWSTLPLTPLYLPLMHSVVRYAGGADVRDREFPTGHEIVARFEPEVNATRATVIRPDGSSERCEIISADGRSEARYAATDLAGVYTIRAGPRSAGAEAKFSLAPPPEESDLTPLDPRAWQQLQTQLGFERIEPRQEPSLAAHLMSATRGGGGGVGGVGVAAISSADRYWLIALAGVLALFVIELALTRAWSAPERGVAR